MSDPKAPAPPSNPIQKPSLVRKLQLPKAGQKTNEGVVKEAAVSGVPVKEGPGTTLANPFDAVSQNPSQLAGDANTTTSGACKNISSIPLPSQPPPSVSVVPPKPQGDVSLPPVATSHHAESGIVSQEMEGSVGVIAAPPESLKSQVKVATENVSSNQNVAQTSVVQEKKPQLNVLGSTQSMTVQSELGRIAVPAPTGNVGGKVVTEIPLPHQSEGLSALVSYSSSSSEASPADSNIVDEKEDINSSNVPEQMDTNDNKSQPINTKAEVEAESTVANVQLEGLLQNVAEKIQNIPVESSVTAIESQNPGIFLREGDTKGIPDTAQTAVADLKLGLKQDTEIAVNEGTAAVAAEDIDMQQVVESTLSLDVSNSQAAEPVMRQKQDVVELSQEANVPVALSTTQALDQINTDESVPDQNQMHMEVSVPDQGQEHQEDTSSNVQQVQSDKGDSILIQSQIDTENGVPQQVQNDKGDVPLPDQTHKEESAPPQGQIGKEDSQPHQEQVKEDIVPHQEPVDSGVSIPHGEQECKEDSDPHWEQKGETDDVVHQELKNEEVGVLGQVPKDGEDGASIQKENEKDGSVLVEDKGSKEDNVTQLDQNTQKDNALDQPQITGILEEKPVTEDTVPSIPKPISEASVVPDEGSTQKPITNPPVEGTLSEVVIEVPKIVIAKPPEVISSANNDAPVVSKAGRKQKRKLSEENVIEATVESKETEAPKKRTRVEEEVKEIEAPKKRTRVEEEVKEIEAPKKRARVEKELSDAPQQLLQAADKEDQGREEPPKTVKEAEEYMEEDTRRVNKEEAQQDITSESFPVESMEYDQMEKNDEESRDGLESKEVSDDLKDKEDTKDDEDVSTPSKRRKKKKKSYERPRGEGGKFMKEKPDPSVLDEETRMDYNIVQDEDSQGSSSKREVRRFRCEVIVPESTEVFTADKVVEYVWPLEGIGEHYFIQEQISQYLGIMSFKRKYPDLRRRAIDMQERDFLKEKGLVSEIACDLGLTAVRSEDVLDVMFNDFPEKFEELQRILREKKDNEIRERGKVNYSMANIDKSKMQEYGRKAATDAARWNANFNKEKRDERRYSFDLQTFSLQMPIGRGKKLPPEYTKIGWFPVTVLPGQYTDYYKEYPSQALKTMPLISVVASPVVPDALGSDGASSESEEEATVKSVEETVEPKEEKPPLEGGPRCKVCGGTRTRNKAGKPEPLIICGTCKSASHPTCIDLTLVMVPKIESYNWQCMDCKTCVTCSNPDDEDKMIFCDMCDRGYHIFCVGLRRVPNGRWHCKECAICSSCGSKTPAGSEHLKNAEWQHEFKKDKDNKQLRYATTLCVPCDKYWKRRQFCYVCLKVYRSIPEDGMVRCSNCPKYIHREVCSTVYENERFCINCFKMRNSTALNHSRIIAAAKKKMASGY